MLARRASILPVAAFLAATLASEVGRCEPVVPAIRAVRSIIWGPSALDTFRRPLGLPADSSRGIFVVADTGNHRLVTLDSSGRSRGSLSYVTDEAKGQLCEPRSVAIDRRGRLYVVDALTWGIEVIAPTGSRLAMLTPDLKLPATADAPSSAPQNADSSGAIEPNQGTRGCGEDGGSMARD